MITDARCYIASMLQAGQISIDDYNLACAILDNNEELINLLQG